MSLMLDGLELPPDMVWVDEFDWSPIAQTETRSLSGALIIETAEKLEGRPITLVGDPESGWITKAKVDALYEKLLITTPLVLTLQNNQTFNVTWRHSEKPVDMKPLKYNRIMKPDSKYYGSIKLIQVS
jgi:hypothetical protein